MAEVSGHVKLRERKRGNQWYLKYRAPSGKQVEQKLGPAWQERSRPPAGYFTRKMADAALAELLTDLRRGAIPDPGARSGKTFADAVAAWLYYVEHEKARRVSTVRGYRAVGRLLEKEFGAETSLEEIDTDRIDTYRRKMLSEGKVTRRTAQQRLVLLHGVLARAKANRWVPTNEADLVERVNLVRSDEFNVLTVDQVEAVAAEASGMYAAAIKVAAYTGLRTGELRALRWRDVDVLGASLRVVRNMPIGGEEGAPKSGHGRSVPLVDQAIVVLDALSKREDFTGDDDRVFPNEAGEMLSDDALRSALYDAMEAAGIDRKTFPAKDGFVFHDLRHTFGTLAAQLEASLVEIQAWMGHAQISTTMRYAHHVPKHGAARRLTEGIARLQEGDEATSPETSPEQPKTTSNHEQLSAA
jgi:integrase